MKTVSLRPGRENAPDDTLSGFPGGICRLPGSIPAFAITFLAAIVLLRVFLAAVPDPLFTSPWSSVLLDADGNLLSAAVAEDGQWRFPGGASLPDRYVKTLLIFEDNRFFTHPGVDFPALLRAAVLNLWAGRIVSGGSTITMQVMRLSRQGSERTYAEKLLEILCALRLELTSTKREILRLYASHAPFGGNVVGLEAASWRYFGRNPDMLTWAECALLAVLPNSPGLMHPGRNRDELLEKRDRLLRRVERKGYVDRRTLELSLLEPLPDEPFPLPQDASHLMFRMQGERADENDRSSIRTSLDASLQRRVNDILLRHGERLASVGVGNAAALVLDVMTGKVLAYAGNMPGPGDGDGRQVDIITSRRSTGSLLKPFLYAAMLDTGELQPQSLVPDIPTRMGSFMPENSTKQYSGAVPADRALSESLNVPAVRLLRKFGVPRFQDTLVSSGMTTLVRKPAEYGLTLILGGAEGTLWELTGMYASLARTALLGSPGEEEAGVRTGFFSPAYVEASGSEAPGTAVFSRGAAWLTLKALLEVERPGDENAWREYMGARKIAWKTGTSYGFRDAWAIGVTTRFAVGIWTGNADGEGVPGMKGSSSAAPILFDVFDSLPASEWFPQPLEDLRRIEVCADSGYPAGPGCGRIATVSIPREAPPGYPCPYCRTVQVDRSGKFRVSTATASLDDIVPVKRFVLPPVMEWFYRRSNISYQSLPPFRRGDPGEQSGGTEGNLSVAFPENGSIMYIPIELDGNAGKAVFQASHRDPDAKVFWHLDGEYLDETVEIHSIEVRPGYGDHVLTLIDDTGEEAAVEFTVLSGE